MNEAELVFSEVLNCDKLSLCLNRDLPVARDKSVLISSVLKRRIQGEPLQYILGKTEFMGLEFKVTPDVFIPRPETEILVEAAVKYSYIVHRTSYIVNILDLGTGSGCIAVSLTKLLSDVDINLMATDISEDAIQIAQSNALLHNVSQKINFIQSDLFTKYEVRSTKYDLIVSNPPYIPSAEIAKLQPELTYEPRSSIDGGRDGLDFYRRIIKDSLSYLRKGGFLLLEMGLGQKEAIKDIFQSTGFFRIIKVIKDYNNIERVMVARFRP